MIVSRRLYICVFKMYIDAMVKNSFHVVAENASVATPMLENLKLLTTEEEMLTEEQSQFVANFSYRQLIGANLYVNVFYMLCANLYVDNCFYTLVIDESNYVLLLLYIDDIIVAATTTALCKQYVEIIAKKYRCTILGELR